MIVKHTHFFLLLFGFFVLFTTCRQRIEKPFKDDEVINKYSPLLDETNTTGNLLGSLSIIDSIFRQNDNPSDFEKVFYYNASCWMNHDMGRYEFAGKKADSCISVLKEVGINENTAVFYLDILLQRSLVNVKLGNSNQAFKDFFDARQTINLLKDTCYRQSSLDKLALVLYRQKDFEQAKNTFFEELNLLKNCFIDNPYLQTGKKQNIIDDIALCYTKLGKFDSARIYYFKAIELIKHTNDSHFLKEDMDSIRKRASYGVVYGNLAKTYIKSNPDSAILLYRKAIELNRAGTAELRDAQLCMFQLAEVLLQNHKVKDAGELLLDLRHSLDTIQNIQAEIGYREQQYHFLMANNQFESAIHAYEDFVLLRDSMNQKESGINTTNINKELRVKEQKLQIELLQKDKRIDTLYLWLIGGVLLLTAAIGLFVYAGFKKSKKQNAELVRLNHEISEQQEITKETLQQLEVSNKDKDRILNVVAHDLRNPIGAIANFLEVVQVKYEHEEDEEKILKTSQEAAVHSLTLINDLLEVNQMQSGKMQLYPSHVLLEDLVGKSMEQLKYKAIAKQQSIRFEKTKDTIPLFCDAEKLQRVITNLLDNAIKFSYIQREIFVSLERNDNDAVLKIKDSGMGIPDEIKKQLFTASITVKRKGTNNEKSHGLGLSICKQIVEAHHGTIEVASKEGDGSTFTIVLPLQTV